MPPPCGVGGVTVTAKGPDNPDATTPHIVSASCLAIHLVLQINSAIADFPVRAYLVPLPKYGPRHTAGTALTHSVSR